MNRYKIALASGLLVIVALACAGTATNLQIAGLPQYVCPSSTPRPTHTQPATSLPLWPPYFAANLSNYQLAPLFDTLYVQWTGQSAGTVYVAYSGSMSTYPYTWRGSGGYVAVDSIPGPTHTRRFPLTVPPNVTRVYVSIYASAVGGSYRHYTAVRLSYPFVPHFYPPPGGAPGGITPTPRPTYTPWPTPTQYVRNNDYFLGDAIYTPAQASGLRLRFRVTDVRSLPAAEHGADGQAQSIYVWTFEVKNVGAVEYDIFPAGQMYVSTITRADGVELNGVWGASIAAAEEAGLTPNYALTDVQSGASKTFTLAAYGPRGTARRIAYVLDVTARGDGDAVPTVVPGQNVVSWLNETNTICTGDIAEP